MTNDYDSRMKVMFDDSHKVSKVLKDSYDDSLKRVMQNDSCRKDKKSTSLFEK